MNFRLFNPFQCREKQDNLTFNLFCVSFSFLRYSICFEIDAKRTHLKALIERLKNEESVSTDEIKDRSKERFKAEPRPNPSLRLWFCFVYFLSLFLCFMSLIVSHFARSYVSFFRKVKQEFIFFV